MLVKEAVIRRHEEMADVHGGCLLEQLDEVLNCGLHSSASFVFGVALVADGVYRIMVNEHNVVCAGEFAAIGLGIQREEVLGGNGHCASVQACG
jgi:hypothetical protein